MLNLLADCFTRKASFAMTLPMILLSMTFYSAKSQTDTTTVFSFEQFMERVKIHHPLAFQAALQTEKGRAAVLNARGAFDPKVFGDVSQKYFDDNQYYSLVNGGLKIPTWFGVEVKAGYEENHGLYLNPENNTASGLWYAGISVPIGQGLFIDERRAALRQAQLYQQATEAERELLLNELFYEAANAYWNWFLKYNNLLVYQNALTLASVRFTAIKQSSLLGDRPAIDTLEASIQLQMRQLSLQQGILDFQNAGLQLSVYLWMNGSIPLELDSATEPEAYRNALKTERQQFSLAQVEALVDSHPKLQLYNFKLAHLDIERRLKMENMKPVLNLNYNPINEVVNGNPFTEYSIYNYKWGAQFSMPLFLRKERGALQMTKLYIRETEFTRSEESLALLNTAKSYWNEWNTTGAQIELYAKTVEDFRKLLDAEQTLLNAGESSLFLVNSRETSYINAQMTLIDLVAKREKAEAGILYSTASFR